MRILAATISHESNSFSSIPTDLGDFRQSRFFDRPESLVELAGTNTVWGGFLSASRELDLDLIPILYASATPAGKVTREAFGVLLRMLTEGLERHGPADGVLLDLHGAMVSEDCDDPEGHILGAVRRVVGDDLAVVAVLDLHANISEAMRKGATVLIGYDTYPHTDMAERGEEAVKLLFRTIRREVKPVSVLIKPPMMPTSQNMATDRDPMRTLLSMARDEEREPGILNVTVSGGFPPADVEDAGFSVVVTADGDCGPARRAAEFIARKAWDARTEFLGGAVSLEQAVQEAVQAHDGPITVVDIADNPASGGPGDGPELVRVLLQKGARNAAFASIADREAVRAAVQAGVGNRISVSLGGKTDLLHGSPLFLGDAYVKTISDGVFTNCGPMKTGVEEQIGRTVLLVAGGISIIVAEKRISPTDLEMFRMLGLEPTRLSVIGLKGKGHFRAAFEPISKRVILAEGPGITGSDLSRLRFSKVRRPIFPLDSNATYRGV